MDITSAYYLAKTGHLISLVIWIGAMLSMTIVLAIHAEKKNAAEQNDLIRLEKTLLRNIINPFMIGAFGFGVWLVFITGAGAPGSGAWMHAKLLLVIVGMGGVHMLLARARKQLEHGTNTRSAGFFGLLSWGGPIIAAVAIALVVFKPF